MADSSKPRRCWHQYSLRTLLLFALVCAIACSWLAVVRQRGAKQREAVAAIQKLGGDVWYDYQLDASGNWIPNAEPPGPAWLRSLLGDYFFTNVAAVYLRDCDVTHAGLEHLKGWTKLKHLILYSTQATDAGLEYLEGLTQLQDLLLGDTDVTDAGLEHLKGLSQLDRLCLEDTQVTDAGLEHLKELTQLQILLVNGTKVTEEGVTRLQQALPNCTIYR